jgi:hypothetical protein
MPLALLHAFFDRLAGCLPGEGKRERAMHRGRCGSQLFRPSDHRCVKAASALRLAIDFRY